VCVSFPFNPLARARKKHRGGAGVTFCTGNTFMPERATPKRATLEIYPGIGVTRFNDKRGSLCTPSRRRGKEVGGGVRARREKTRRHRSREVVSLDAARGLESTRSPTRSKCEPSYRCHGRASIALPPPLAHSPPRWHPRQSRVASWRPRGPRRARQTQRRARAGYA